MQTNTVLLAELRQRIRETNPAVALPASNALFLLKRQDE